MNLYIDVPRRPEASPRLSRSQLAQKIGTATNGYPRPAGVLVPRALAEICRSLPASNQDRNQDRNGDRRQRGREIVSSVSRSLRRLTPALLDLEMPHPSAALRTLPIEDRTRSVIDRFLPILAKEPSWTVGRYLRIPKFGARCLVDLLAACEETASGTTVAAADATGAPQKGSAGRTVVPFTPIDLGRLDDIARLLGNLLPMSGSDLARLLIDEGLATATVTLEHVTGVFRSMDRPAPFRAITCSGTEIALAGDANGFAATVAATAVRLVSHWGLSTVESLVERVRLLRAAPTSRSFVCRLLVALPRLRWLDSTMEWFSFLGDRSRLARGIAKVFAVAQRVPFSELRLALGKGQARAPQVPGQVLTRYLSDVAHCQLDGELVVSGERPDDAAPAGDEAVLVDLLGLARPDLDLHSLRSAAAARAVPPESVRRLLRDSPLFLRTRRSHFRLVGLPQPH
jgi:hypothetical protein